MTIEEIAAKVLGIKTLEAQNSDSLDFHELSVWQIKRALEMAYLNGSETVRPTKRIRGTIVIEVSFNNLEVPAEEAEGEEINPNEVIMKLASAINGIPGCSMEQWDSKELEVQ